MGNHGRDISWKSMALGLVVCAILVCLLGGILLLFMASGSPPALTNSMSLKLTGNGTVTDDELLSAKNTLQKRFDALDYNVSISPTRDSLSTVGLTANYDNISSDKMAMLATTPGLIDVRIQTAGNESQHILYGDEIASARVLSSGADANGSEMWGISILLTSSGARGMQQACIQYGATTDSVNHSISFLLDGKPFYSAPLSSGLAGEMAGHPVEAYTLSTGPGDAGKNMADLATACLRSGVLPLRIEVAGNAAT